MHFDELLVTGASWALVVGAGWAVLVLAAAVLEVVSEGRVALTGRLGCPAPARRAVLAGVSVLLAGGGALAAGPVAAAPAPLDTQPGQGAGSTLPVPARPTGAAYAVPRQRVEVKPGDSLWRISQQQAPRAAAADLARIVQRTYRTNRQVIGPDPDLIRPGQRLVVPPQRRPPQAPPTAEPRWETP